MENILQFLVQLESGRKKYFDVYFDKFEYDEKRKNTNFYVKDELIMSLDLNVTIELERETLQGLKFYKVVDKCI